MSISVITATYNRKEYLKEAIESIQKNITTPLSNASFEHIIYDDHSTDKTETIFENSKWDNLSYVYGKKNKGQSFSKNQAITKAKGEYIFILDSDDIALQRTIYNFLVMTNSHLQTDWFIADFLRIEENGKYRSGEDYYGWNFNTPNEMLDAIVKGKHFLQGNVLFRKALFEKVGGFNENLRMAEDLDLYIRFLLQNSMPKFANFISHLHRVHPGNISLGETPEKHTKRIKSIATEYNLLLP